MDVEVVRRFLVDEVEEFDPFLVPMARHARADDVARQRAQRRKEGSGPIPLVVVRHRTGPPLLDRQPRLGPVECLNLALLIDGEDERLGRRVEIETDNLVELLCEVRVVADLAGTDQVRLQAVAFPDTLDARRADAELRGQGPGAPVRGGDRRLPCRLADDGPLDRAALHRRRAPSARRVFLTPGRPLLREPAPPQAHGFLPYAKLDGDGLVQPPVGGPQHDLGASPQARRRATTSGPSPQDSSIFIGHCNGWGNSWHAPYSSTLNL